MPVSNPSYFPPARSVDRIIGTNAGANQLGDRVFLAGFTAGANSQCPDMIAIGSSAVSDGWAGADGTIAIGSGAATVAQPVSSDASTMVGYRAAGGVRTFLAGSVLVGANAGLNAAAGVLSFDCTLDRSVIIGTDAAVKSTNCTPLTPDVGVVTSVIIGQFAWFGANCQLTDSIIIGQSACSAFSGVGDAQSGILAIGVNTDTRSDGLVIGNNASGAGSDMVIAHGGIGYFYGNTNGIEIGLGNRDLGAGSSNILKIPDGVKGSTVTGGGFLYAAAGALHWVGSGGTDTVIAPA